MYTERNPHLCRILLWCLEANLNDRETDVIMWRYGVERITLEHIGKKAFKRKVTRECIRRIESKALVKLKRYITKIGIDKQFFE